MIKATDAGLPAGTVQGLPAAERPAAGREVLADPLVLRVSSPDDLRQPFASLHSARCPI